MKEVLIRIDGKYYTAIPTEEYEKRKKRAIIEIDMPNTCRECKLSYLKLCTPLNLNIEEYINYRYDGCPLKEVEHD